MRSVPKKFLLAIMMSAAALLGLLFLGIRPLGVSAEGGVFTVLDDPYATHYSTLSDAIAAASNAGGQVTVYVDGTAALTQTQQVDAGTGLTLKKLGSDSSSVATLERAEGFSGELFHVSAGGTLTLDGVTLEGHSRAASAAAIVSEGNVTLRGATVSGFRNTSQTAWGSALYAATDSTTKLESVFLSDNEAAKGGDVTVAGEFSAAGNSGFFSNDHSVYALAGARPSLMGNIPRGKVYLSNGVTMEVAGLRTSGTHIEVEVEEDRPDGPILTSAAADYDFAAAFEIGQPVLSAEYLSGYAYRARYLRTLPAEKGEEYGYGGVGVNVSQETRDKLSFDVRVTDMVVPSLVIGEIQVPLAEQGGDYLGTADLPAEGTELRDWRVKLSFKETAQEIPFAEAVPFIRIDRANGTFAAPADTYYMADGEKKLLGESGLLPNDLTIGQDGIAEFYFGDELRRVYTGVRAVLPDDFGGELYDVYNQGEDGYIVIIGRAGVEYALMPLNDAPETTVAWEHAASNGRIVFSGLTINTEYRLSVRAAAGDGLVGGYHVLDGAYRTLSGTMNTASTKFIDLYAAYNTQTDVKQKMPSALVEMLACYAELDDYLRSLERLKNILASIKEEIPNAMRNEWQKNFYEELSPDVEITDKNFVAAKEAIARAVQSYFSLEQNIRERFTTLTEEELIDAIQRSIDLLREDFVAAIGRAKEAAGEEMAIDKAYVLKEYGLVSEGATGGYQPALTSLGEVEGEYNEFIGAVAADENSLDNIKALVAEAGRVFRVQAYYEAHRMSGLFGDAIAAELGGALNEAKAEVKGTAGDGREYDAMLRLYKAYARIVLSESIGGEGFEALFENELGRIGEVGFAAEQKKDKDSLPPLEERIQTILAQAKAKGEVQKYYNDLFLPADGRLCAAGLKETAALDAALEEAFSALEQTTDDAARTKAAEEGKLSLYKTLALGLLEELYADMVHSDALQALYDAAAEQLRGITLTGTLESAEGEVYANFLNAENKLAVRAYYENLQKRFAGLAPDESELAAIYAAIERAGNAEKEGAAYEGMLDLYRAYAKKAIDSVQAASEAQDKGNFAATGKWAADGVKLGEGGFADMLRAAEAELDAIVEDVTQKLLLRAYFEKLNTDALESVYEAALGAVGGEQTAADKRTAGYEGRRSLYEAYTLGLLRTQFEADYADPSEPLTALLTEAEERVKGTGFEGVYTDEALHAIEETMDGIRLSAIQKFAVRSYFDGLVAAKKQLAPAEAELAPLYGKIDGADDKAEAAFAGMAWLYAVYGKNAVAAEHALHAPSEAVDKVRDKAVSDIQAAASSVTTEETLRAAETAIDGLLVQASADMMQQDYDAFLAAYPALAGTFSEVTGEHAKSLEAARDAFAALNAQVQAFYATQAPQYANTLEQNNFALKILDYLRKARFEEARAAAHAQLDSAFGDYEADDALAKKLAAAKESASARVDGIVYEAYSAAGDNRDPSSDAYFDGLSASLREALLAGMDGLEDVIALDEIQKFAQTLSAELASYTRSRLHLIDAATVRAAYEEVRDRIAAAVETDTSESLSGARAGILEMREAYAEAVVTAYAELVGAEPDLGGVASAADDAGKKNAMFDALLAACRAHALRESGAYADFAESAAAGIGALTFGERTDEGLALLESAAEALVASARYKDAVRLFHANLLEKQGLTGELSETLQAQYAAIDAADTAQKEQKSREGIAALAAKALRLYAAKTGSPESEIAAALTSLTAENADTMSETLASEEEKLLRSFLVRTLALYTADGAASFVESTLSEERTALEALLVHEGALADAILPMTKAVLARAAALPARILGSYYAFLAESYPAHPALASAKQTCDELAAASSDAASAHAAVRTLYAFFVGEFLTALKTADDSAAVTEVIDGGIAEAKALASKTAPAGETDAVFTYKTACAILRTVVSTQIGLAKQAALAAIGSKYSELTSNPFAMYSEEGKAALQAACTEGESAVKAVGTDLSLEAAQKALGGIVENTEKSLGAVKIVASSKGVDTKGNGSYGEDQDAAELWGIIENEGGMSASVALQMAIVEAEALFDVTDLVGDKEIKAVFEIALGEEQFAGTYLVKVLLPATLTGVEGIQVIAMGNGGAEDLTVRREGNFLIFETTHFSRFYLYGEREVHLWWVIFILTFLLVAELIVIVWLGARLYRKLNGEKRSETVASFGAATLLAILLPRGTVVVSIVLSVLIVLSAIAIGVLIYLLKRPPHEVRMEKKLERAHAKALRKAQREAEAEVERRELERIREEAKVRAEQAAHAREEARLKAEEEARLKAEEETRLKAEEEARLKAEEEARLKAEEEARLKAEEEARLKAEEEARLKAEEEARLKAEEEARLKAEEEARLKAEEVARLKAEEEARMAAEPTAEEAEQLSIFDLSEETDGSASEQAPSPMEDPAPIPVTTLEEEPATEPERSFEPIEDPEPVPVTTLTEELMVELESGSEAPMSEDTASETELPVDPSEAPDDTADDINDTIEDIHDMAAEPEEEAAEDVITESAEESEEEPAEEATDDADGLSDDNDDILENREDTIEQPSDEANDAAEDTVLDMDESADEAEDLFEETAEELPDLIPETPEEEPIEHPDEEASDESSELVEELEEEPTDESSEPVEQPAEELSEPEEEAAEEQPEEAVETEEEDTMSEEVAEESIPEEPEEVLAPAQSEEPIEPIAEPAEEEVEQPAEPVSEQQVEPIPEQPEEEQPTEPVSEQSEELPAEPVSEQPEEAQPAEPIEQPAEKADAEEPVILEEIPQEYQLPAESIRVEVAASEVNGLMQDAVAKQLIEESVRIADKSKSGIVNVDTLGEYFESGERVTLEELKARVPFFGKKVTYVKVLARGRLNKALIVEGDDFSLEAVKMIALVGGHVIRTRRR